METVVQNVWSKSKLLVKGMIIGLLVLILQIPTFYIQNLIEEREDRQKQAIAEVSSKWAGRQNITGPMLVLPYWDDVTDTSVNMRRTKHLAYFLPDDLKMNATAVPQEKYRGIYKVMLYTSKVNLSGAFADVQPEKLKISPENVIWNEAYVQQYVSDAKGLNEEMTMQWNNQALPLSTSTTSNASGEILEAPLNISGPDDLKNIHFSLNMNLSGSEELLFTPTGKATSVTLNSNWPHPSFTGDILPQHTAVKDSGFTATWKSLAHKRSFPQQWKDDDYIVSNAGPIPPMNSNGDREYVVSNTTSTQVRGNDISNAAFGVRLFVPVNGYQKTMRSVKYSALCILLTFAAFFLIETTNRKSVHPFQYGLIGLALVLFYTLLLSFSEYIGFNFSYAVASVCTIGLIAWFVKGLLGSARLSTILSTVLVLMYTYVFTILQLQDYSLLLGSIGLFITLAVVMHFSKKVQW